MTTYHNLTIETELLDCNIWLSDDQGFLVSKQVGRMDIRLLPGTYYMQTHPAGEKHQILLNADTTLLKLIK